MFALPASERMDFNISKTNSWDIESNHAFEFLTPVMFLHLADLLRQSGANVWEHLGCVAKVEMELTTLGMFLQTLLHRVMTSLTPDNVTRFCGYDCVLIRASKGTICFWFAMGIFRVLCRIHCNPMLVLLAIDRLAEFDRDAKSVGCFSFEYKRSEFNFILPVPLVMRKRADVTEVSKGVCDVIRPVYREEFANPAMNRDLFERSWQLFPGKSDDYTEYPMLVEQNHVVGYWNTAVASEEAERNLMSGADANIDNLPEAVYDEENWNFEGSIGKKSAHRVGIKRKSQDL